MNKTLSFVGLDFNLIKPYRTSILFLIALGVAMGIGFRSTSTLASYFMMSLMLIMSYPFSIGDKNGLDTLYGTLAISKKTVVTGRYMFAVTLEMICAALSIILSWVLSFIIKTDYIITDELFTLCLLSFIFSLIVAIQYPIYFKYGYNKAKVVALVPLLIIFILIVNLPTIAKLFAKDFSWNVLFLKLMENDVLMYVAMVIAGFGLLYLSSFVSYKVYDK
jgi:ABC-2 type transport system permease protein